MIEISRTDCGESATMGTLSLKKGDQGWNTWQTRAVYDTLEPPNQCNTLDCNGRIPSGSYAAVAPRWSPTLQRNTIWLQNTHPREWVLIHPGNNAGDTEGCILVGERDGTDYSLRYGSSQIFDSILNQVSNTELVVKIVHNCPGEEPDDGGGIPPCFPSSARVRLHDGSLRALPELQAGDLIQTFDAEGRVRYEPFLMDFHNLNDAPFPCLRLKHADGALEVSPMHLVFVSETHAVRAATLVPGDSLLIAGVDGKLRPCSIISIEKFTAHGRYAPLTFSGQLLVEGVAVSSYSLPWPDQLVQKAEKYAFLRNSLTHAHSISHAIVAPLRWATWLTLPFGGLISAEKRVGAEVHWYASLMLTVLETFVLQVYPELRMHVPPRASVSLTPNLFAGRRTQNAGLFGTEYASSSKCQTQSILMWSF